MTSTMSLSPTFRRLHRNPYILLSNVSSTCLIVNEILPEFVVEPTPNFGVKSEMPRPETYNIRGMDCHLSNCSITHEVLCVKGIRYSLVDTIGAVFEFQCVDDVRGALNGLAYYLYGADSPFEGIVDAQWDTHFPEKISAGGCQNLPLCLVPFVLKLVSLKLSVLKTDMDTKKAVIFLSRGRGYYAEDDLSQGVFNRDTLSGIRERLQSSRIFVDVKGNLGIGSNASQQGDVVCVLRGATAPCILRPRHGDGWTLISGDCYMDGELGSDKNTYLLSNIVDPYPDQEEEFLIW
ncbi:uncharacterized protein BDZ99DRAFT_553219 [Mytilinidion resinicola]|uniref:Uncharacterized protein n=1 Tax=Mytilinidion resinicola TaxID=574789 RepID=A0A6A6Y090_9PEZI|nr:uncharacterized protein BDZ99DRAFT_553219 [Mytilinidion resinicola]KAF2801424.1 hypothetical protein BDZ99DRAFT_553219 [Mytilinidion resinicola]